MNLIGITGKVVDLHGADICIMNSGKDLCANTLAKGFLETGKRFIIASFASALIDIATKSSGLNNRYFTSRDLKNKPLTELEGVSPRTYIINIGKELRTKHGDDVLAQILYSKYSDFDGYVIVPDVRTFSEASFIRSYGVLYSVTRFAHCSRSKFIRDMGINFLDKATETPLSPVIGDINVSLDVLEDSVNINYLNESRGV